MPGFVRVDSLSSSRKYSHTVAHSVPSCHLGGICREPISNKRKRIVFVVLACSNIATNMCLALIAPIFPQVAESKGVSLVIQGWIFGVFALAQCLFSPLFGKLIPHIGVKFTFVWGTIFTSGCCVLFGCLAWIEDTTTFIVFCFVVRIFLALGTIAMNTAVFVIVMIVWPEQVAYTLGTLESLIGIGLMVGPAMAGVLYDAGGFYLPFLVVGVIIFMLGITASFALAAEAGKVTSKGDSQGNVSVFSLLRIKEVLFITISCCGIACTWITLDPTLQPHLEQRFVVATATQWRKGLYHKRDSIQVSWHNLGIFQFGLSATVVGFVFLIPAMCYAIVGPFVGKLVDKLENTLPLIIFGFFAVAICFLFFGPSPILGLQNYQELWLNFTSLAALGLTFAFAVVPIYERLITYTKRAGYPDNMSTMSSLGSLFWSAYSAGDFIGPVVANILVESVGFQWCMTIVAAFLICLGCSVTIFWLLSRGNHEKRRIAVNSYQPLGDEERVSLIGP